jgi:dienelactone hydrolase
MTASAQMAERLKRFLGLKLIKDPVPFDLKASATRDSYERQLIDYRSGDGETIPAFLLLPEGDGPFPAVIIHHQHASQRHLGKSEVVGLAGDPLQAFGHALAQRGFIVLAPDSICFEDRRKHASGTGPHEKDDLSHFTEMGHRLTQGDTLMRKVLSDASCGLSLLVHHPRVDAARIGALGHSMGGNTVLFQAALDRRIAFSASSGALCSYAYEREHDVPLEMALVIPGFAANWDLHHLLECIAPRSLLVVSAADDPYSEDADQVIARADPNHHITHFRGAGGHAMTADRFRRIIRFFDGVKLNNGH